MRQLSLLAAFAVACSSPPKPEPAPPPQPEAEPQPAAAVKTYDAKAFYDTTSYSGGSFSADESKVLLTSDATGVYNVYAQPVEGGDPVPLTSSTTDSIFGISYFPADDRFLYSSDKGGNELTHIYVVEPGKEPRDLTPGAKLKASFAGWSGDKESFYVITNERDPKSFDLYRYAAEGYARKMVFKNPGGFEVGDISPDGRYVALDKPRNNADSDIYLYDARRKRRPALITKHDGDVEHQTVTFSRDSARLYYRTNQHGEFAQIWSHEIKGGKKAPEIEAKWDVVYASFSETGRYRVSLINADARTVLEIYDTRGGKPVAIANLPAGDITSASFSRSEKKMAFYLSSDRQPRNLFILDVASGEHKQLTRSLNPAIDPADLVDGEVVRYKSFDGREIPAILYKPKQAASGPVPALVWVHGGPGGQSRLGYRAMLQHLVNHGYAILAVNNRGSSGYGKTFFHLDDKNHGEGDLKDCIWGRKYLEGLDWIDRDKVGIIGGSYGGYMVLAALAFEPESFEVGVDIFGVANWVRTLKSIPPWWDAFREALYAELGDPKTDLERLRRISPLFHAEKIARPLLVIQGANDPRVLKVESDEIVAAVKKNNVPVDYVVFDDEGHGFRKKVNRITASDSILGFLDKHLR